MSLDLVRISLPPSNTNQTPSSFHILVNDQKSFSSQVITRDSHLKIKDHSFLNLVRFLNVSKRRKSHQLSGNQLPMHIFRSEEYVFLVH